MDIFVTSTGNNSGKTIFSAGVAAVMQSLGYEMAVFKPVQTGCKYAKDKQFSPDLNFVKKMDPNIKTYSSFNFKQNGIPAIVADFERTKIKTDTIIREYNKAKKENDIIIVEGVHSLLTPITARISSVDIAETLNLKTVVIIDTNENDFVTKTITVLKAAENYSIDIAGLIFNNYSPNSKNDPHHAEVDLLQNMLEYEALGSIPNVNYTGEGINPEILISEILQNIDLSKVFDMEIPKLI